MESTQLTEIYIKKVLAGNIQDVRLRLIDASETLGYDILEDEPNIIGRRAAKGWGTWFGSADVLDYATTLTMRLKSVGESSTRVTFDYSVKHGMLNKGEKAIVLQEAKTIAAISKMQALEKLCPVCDAESTDDSKFCRKCGAPLTTEQAELEVLRLMAETRAGKTAVVASTISSLLSIILVVSVLIFNNVGLIGTKLFPILLGLGGLGFVFATVSSFFGWNRLKHALKQPETKVQHTPRTSPELIAKNKVRELPPQRVAPASVTEGTTNLLDKELTNLRKREKVPILNKRTTNNFD